MEVVMSKDIRLGGGSRLIKRLYKVPQDKNFPDGLKFALQYLVFIGDKWVEAARVDNYPHYKRKTGAHIHKWNRKEVEFKDFSFEEAEAYVISVGERLKLEIVMEAGKGNGEDRDSS